MQSATNEMLFDIYEKALEQNLDKEFIKLVEEEIKRRGLSLK